MELRCPRAPRNEQSRGHLVCESQARALPKASTRIASPDFFQNLTELSLFLDGEVSRSMKAVEAPPTLLSVVPQFPFRSDTCMSSIANDSGQQ